MNYRTTAQNLHFAVGVLSGADYTDLEQAEETTSDYRSARNGPVPELLACESQAAELDVVAAKIKAWLDEGDVEPESIAVLTRSQVGTGLAAVKPAVEAAVGHQSFGVANLGPSYFTKFLYFGGFGANTLMPQPLIMDDNVIKALEELTKESWDATAVDYVRYINLAADWASHFLTSSDVIERRLYEIGE